MNTTKLYFDMLNSDADFSLPLESFLKAENEIRACLTEAKTENMLDFKFNSIRLKLYTYSETLKVITIHDHYLIDLIAEMVYGSLGGQAI